MKEKTPLHNILLVSGMVGLLVISIIFDLATQSMAEQNMRVGGLELALVWLFPMMQLIWMLGVVGLVWFFLSSDSYGRWVCAIYLVLGLFLLYMNPILYVNELPDAWYVLVEYLSPGTWVFQTGGVLTAVGLIALWFWKKPDQAKGTSLAENSLEDESQTIETEPQV